MKKRDPIPSSDNIEELAEFWQTHDSTDYLDLFVEVPGPLVRRSAAIRVPLNPTEEKAVKKLAEAKGLSTGELIHKWVAEKITRAKRAKRTKR
ncbi:MAG TPA: CopG family antitoxin [Urbifossiella sp.]|nr:CopG family antitoxin [Urbifossiella sp.]